MASASSEPLRNASDAGSHMDEDSLYFDFLSLTVTDRKYLNALYNVVKRMDTVDVATSLVSGAAALHCEDSLLKELLRIEFSRFCAEDNMNAILRGHSLATKVVDALSQHTPNEFYLKPLLKDAVQEIIANPEESYEIDPEKIQGEHTAEELEELLNSNLQCLLKGTQLVLDQMFSQIDTIPYELRVTVYHIYLVAEEFHLEPLPYVGGFVILRFLNPFIVMPDQKGIIDNMLKPDQRRKLMLVSKLLQNVSNEVEFGEKEAFMKRAKVFADENAESINWYLRELSQNPQKFSRGTFSQSESPIEIARSLLDGIQRYKEGIAAFLDKEYAESNESARWLALMDELEKVEEARRAAELQEQQRRAAEEAARQKEAAEYQALLEEMGPVSEEYQEMLNAAAAENFEDFERENIIYFGGQDKFDRTVVMVVAGRIPERDRLDRFLLFVVHKLDKVVQRPYVIVSCQHDMSNSKRPPFSWIKKVYKLLSRQYKKNLKALYLVHSGFVFKFIFKLVSMFMASKFRKKIHKVRSCEEVFQLLGHDAAPFPLDVIRYDMTKQRSKNMVPRNVFSVALTSVGGPISSDGLPEVIIRSLDYVATRGLKSDGIFRQSGSKITTDYAEEAINLGYNVYLEDLDVYVVASLIKRFIRQAPQCLLHPYMDFVEVGVSLGQGREEEATDRLKQLIRRLPTPNASLLSRLLRLSKAVLENGSMNNMSAGGLGTVFAPSCMFPILPDGSRDHAMEMKHIHDVKRVMIFLVENAEKFY